MRSIRTLTTILSLSVAMGACFLLPAVGELTGGETSGDAATDAADVARDAADASTCDATFCDDFDRGPLGATWTEIRGLDAGSMSLGAPAVSPPNALVISHVDGGGAQRKLPMLVKDLPKGSNVRCSFSVLGDQLPTNGAGDVLVFLFSGGASFVDNEILLSMDKTGLGLREDVFLLDGGCACPKFQVGPFPFPTGLFTRITMETDFKVARIFVNDVLTRQADITGAGPSQVRVFFGFDRPKGTSRVRFDDFSCTVTP